ncbi:MAG TPA: PatB family C-S lyase [Anaeromyxobacteraceae bacterium]|nr:PatB family C-S lyase [Anaeromyxobacteraceae bacterium]
MAYDFDDPPDRRGTDSVKWGRYAGRDVLPLWVADMDFAAPPPVLDAIRRRVGHGVLGYGAPWPSLVSAVQDHLSSEYGWEVEPGWIVWLPGLVTGLNVACRAVEGGAFTATPVYPPYLTASPRLATAPLRLAGGRWEWDLPAVEAALAPDTRLFLLCHPHNPVGRAWDERELRALDALAERRGLVVCSDEIHCGLVLDPARRHVPYATLSPGAARRSITLMAPSKTFNVPGLGCAFAVVPDPALRRAFRGAMQGIVPHVNVLGLVACEAAYRDGGDWHRALIEHLRGNAARVQAAIGALPGLRTTPVEATYLAWIDARGTGVADPHRALEQAGVGLSDGAEFGPGDAYRGFVRLNFGCSRALLDEALARIGRAFPAER